MAKNSPALSNFNAGELSPDAAARVDMQKYAAACSGMSRFIPRVQGPARRTPGTRFAAVAKTLEPLVRKFIFSQGEAYTLEFGAGYIRFYSNHAQLQVSGVAAWSSSTSYAQGALVSYSGSKWYAWNSHGMLNGQNLNQTPAAGSAYWYALSGTIYEIPTPWSAVFNADGTPGIQIEQSADVLYIAAAAFGYFPMMLSRLGNTDWTLSFYWPPDGPFLDENTAASPAVYVAPISGSPGQYDIYSTAPLFSPSDAEAVGGNLFVGSMVAAHSFAGTNGYSQASAQGSLTPTTDSNGYSIAFFLDNNNSGGSFNVGITSGSGLGASYFTTVTVAGSGINVTLNSSSATYAYSEGVSSWSWPAELGITPSDSYTVTLTLGLAIAGPGRLIRIEAQWFNIPPWTSGNGITAGFYRRYNGNTYLALNSNTTGSVPPTHTFGVAWDGSAGVQWLYVDSGYGIAEVTSFVSSTHVKGTATYYSGGASSPTGKQQYLFPTFVQATSAAITGISKASQAVVTFGAIPSGLTVGDPLYLTGVGGMTQISEQMYTVVASNGTTTATIDVDSSGYTTYTSGGTGIRNASLNWQMGAWAYPIAQTPGGWPSSVCLWEDRLFWGGGVNGISWWGSAPGAYQSMTQDLYGQVTADCAIDGIISAQEVDQITWMSAAYLLLIGTKGGEFGLGPLTTTEPIGPGNTSVERQSKFRSRSIRAELIGTSNYYVQLGGKKVYAQDYNFYLNRYDSTNQNRLANHILGYTVVQGAVDIAYHAEPYESLWGVRADGILVSYTLDRQDDVTGWAEQPMAPSLAGPANVISACVIPAPDDTRDELWLAVQRTINGALVTNIEYLEKDYETGDAASSQCYFDCSVQQTGITGTSVTGLSWLIGETVGVLMDGIYQGTFTVNGSGDITLANAGNNSTLQVGLPYTSTLTTMDLEGGADVGTAQGKLKRPNSLVARLKNAQGIQIAVAPGQPNYPATAAVDALGNSTYVGVSLPLFTGDCARLGLVADVIPNCKLTVTCPYPFQCELQGMFPNIVVNEPNPG